VVRNGLGACPKSSAEGALLGRSCAESLTTRSWRLAPLADVVAEVLRIASKLGPNAAQPSHVQG